MKKDIYFVICNVVFGLLCIGLFHLLPYIAWYTMEGDKTDIILGLGLGVIPMGLVLLSILYGFLTKRIVLPICIASIVSHPVIFIPFVGGNTIIESLYSLVLIVAAIVVIVGIGTVLGILVRSFLVKLRRIFLKNANF